MLSTRRTLLTLLRRCPLKCSPRPLLKLTKETQQFRALFVRFRANKTATSTHARHSATLLLLPVLSVLWSAVRDATAHACLAAAASIPSWESARSGAAGSVGSRADARCRRAYDNRESSKRRAVES